MRTWLAYLFVLLAGLHYPAHAAQGEIELCHVANAGFALQTPGGSVLVDALFRAGLPDYQRASDELIPGAVWMTGEMECRGIGESNRN